MRISVVLSLSYIDCGSVVCAHFISGLHPCLLLFTLVLMLYRSTSLVSGCLLVGEWDACACVQERELLMYVGMDSCAKVVAVACH